MNFREATDRVMNHLAALIASILVVIVGLLVYLVFQVGTLNKAQKTDKCSSVPEDSILRLPGGYFQAEESVINDSARWPKTEEAIEKLFATLDSRTAELNAVQRMDAAQDVERIEWSLNALRFLAVTDKSRLERSEWQDLIDRAPTGAPAALVNAVQDIEPSSEGVFINALADAEKLLKTKVISGAQLSEMWNRLDSLPQTAPEAQLEKLGGLKTKLQSALLNIETRETCEEVQHQLSLLSKLPASEQNLVAATLLNRLVDMRLRWALKESESEPAVLTTMVGIVRELVETQRQSSRMEYQRTALDNIRKFKKVTTNVDHDAVLNALKTYLLPISEQHLERPVAILYNEVFDGGFKQLWIEDREELAEAAAVIIKLLPRS